AAAIPLLTAARAWHQRRPGVRAFRARLSRGNTSLCPVRRRGHAPSDVRRDREGGGNGSASDARLIRAGAFTLAEDVCRTVCRSIIADSCQFGPLVHVSADKQRPPMGAVEFKSRRPD